jgi:hypothetical protein
LGRNSEAGEPYVVGVVDEHISRLDVFMDEAVLMDLAESCRQADGDVQGATQIERLPLVPLKNLVQRFTARVVEYKDCPPFVTGERQRRGCPRGLKFGGERVFVFEAPEALRRRLFRGWRHYQDRRWVAGLPAAIKGEVWAFP